MSNVFKDLSDASAAAICCKVGFVSGWRGLAGGGEMTHFIFDRRPNKYQISDTFKLRRNRANFGAVREIEVPNTFENEL
jgi:hypothetical protein